MGEEYNFLWARLYQTMILHLVVSRSSLQRVLTPRELCIQIIKLRLSCLKTYLFLIRLTWANLLWHILQKWWFSKHSGCLSVWTKLNPDSVIAPITSVYIATLITPDSGSNHLLYFSVHSSLELQLNTEFPAGWEVYLKHKIYINQIHLYQVEE